jgi:transcription antitermination factor NusG
MSWTTTTNTNFKIGDKVKIVNGAYKEFLDGVFTIKSLSSDLVLCILEELKPFKVIRTKHLKFVNVLEIE